MTKTLYSKKTIRENSCNSWTACLCNSRTFFFLILFVVFSCTKSPTDSRTGTLTGTVLLEGQPVCTGRQDHSGITVALYKLASPREIDSCIIFSLVDMKYTCVQKIFFEMYFISQGEPCLIIDEKTVQYGGYEIVDSRKRQKETMYLIG